MAVTGTTEKPILDFLPTAVCEHYIRRCALVSPCCGKIYQCRLCHDAVENHELDRKEVNQIKCNQCDTIQALSPRCTSCNIKFGLYYCQICRLFDDNDRGQFHCEQCGSCRVGGRDNFEHCVLCGICFKIGRVHTCIEECSRSDCPICLEDLHSSQADCQKLPCGHMMHVPCFRQLIENDRRNCPICCREM